MGPKVPLEAEGRLKGPLGPIGDPSCYPHWGGYWYVLLTEAKAKLKAAEEATAEAQAEAKARAKAQAAAEASAEAALEAKAKAQETKQLIILFSKAPFSKGFAPRPPFGQPSASI